MRWVALLPTPLGLAAAVALAGVAIGANAPWAEATAVSDGWFTSGTTRRHAEWEGEDGATGRALAAVATMGAALVGLAPLTARARAWLAVAFGGACGALVLAAMPHPEFLDIFGPEYEDVRYLWGARLAQVGALAAIAAGAVAWWRAPRADAEARELGARLAAASLAAAGVVGAVGPWVELQRFDAAAGHLVGRPAHGVAGPVGLAVVVVLVLAASAAWAPWPRRLRWLAAAALFVGAFVLLVQDAHPLAAAGEGEYAGRVLWGYVVSWMAAALAALACLVQALRRDAPAAPSVRAQGAAPEQL